MGHDVRVYVLADIVKDNAKNGIKWNDRGNGFVDQNLIFNNTWSFVFINFTTV